MSGSDPLIDDIGALLDEMLEDPARAALLKARIRERLAGAQPSRPPVSHGQAETEAEAEAEDLWDNVPL